MCCFVNSGTYSSDRKFGLRLFKPIAQRILEMRSKLKHGARNGNDGKWKSSGIIIYFEFAVCAVSSCNCVSLINQPSATQIVIVLALCSTTTDALLDCSHFISLVLAQDDSYSEIQCNTPVHVVVFNNRLLVAVTNSTNHDVVLSCQSRDNVLSLSL